jgi:hypothetical protein
MDNNRRSRRTKAVLPLKVFGTTSDGEPFSELVHTLDISLTGSRIAGVQQELRAGDVITLQYKYRRATFKVVWVRRPGSDTRIFHVGLECLENSDDFWGVKLVEQGVEMPELPDRVLTRNLQPGGANSFLRRISGSG